MDIINHAYLAGGCFWCTEAIYKRLKGVFEVTPGYSGGDIKNPSYKEVCSGRTGHAETIEIIYNPEQISFKKLLDIFFNTHNPTTLNRQGNDVGSHYRSIVFFSTIKERDTIKDYIQNLDKSNIFKNKIVTEVVKFKNFYKAENYHENYYELNKNQTYCDLVITPKIKKFESNFKNRLL